MDQKQQNGSKSDTHQKRTRQVKKPSRESYQFPDTHDELFAVATFGSKLKSF